MREYSVKVFYEVFTTIYQVYEVFNVVLYIPAVYPFVVFSSMGFYPVTPGSPTYNIGSPFFENVKINLGNGKFFEIEALGCSDENKYIQSATLNGKDWNKPWFSHQDLINGGKLVLKMGSKANRNWGNSENDVPPSAEAY